MQRIITVMALLGGLDKANTWSQINNFKTLRLYGVVSNNLVMYPPSGEKGDSSTFGFNIICSDKNLGNYAASGVANIGMGQSGGMSYVAMNASTKGSIDNNIHSIQIGLQITASDNANIGSFYPTQNGGINLGTSTNKWKTLNGINPGALSLPGTGGYTDIKGDITNLSGGDNTFTAPYDGWVCVKSANATVIHIINTNWAVCQSTTQNTAGTLCCLCPVMSGQSFRVIVNATSLDYAYIHPCKGNV